MTFNPDVHHRRSIRLQEYDYRGAGVYFVTLCALQHECLFGEIADGTMSLNDSGLVVNEYWQGIPTHFPHVEMDTFAIMPNHFHGIVRILDNFVGAKQGSSASPGFNFHDIQNECKNLGEAGETFASPLLHGTLCGSLGSVIQNFKSISTRMINKFRNNPGCPVWQRNYYERVIRNELELTKVREYIANNPMKWALDKENPVNLKKPIA